MSNGPIKKLNLGKLAVLHAALLALFLSWRFGGMEPATRTIAAWLCLPAPVLTVLAWRAASMSTRKAAAWVLVPLGLLTLQVAVSALNPSRQVYAFWDTEVLREIAHVGWLPSTPLPRATLVDYALNAGLLLCGLNLMFCRPSRTGLRGLLWTVALNGVVLAVVGTVFKLLKTDAILGRVNTPNPNFFATFIYHNHWGAFALLCAGIVLALMLRTERRAAGRSLTSTAVPLLGLAAAVLLCSIPLSTGRASTVAAGLLVVGTAAIFTPRLWRRLRHAKDEETGRRVGMLLTVVTVIAFGALLGGEALRHEWNQTRSQIDDIRAGGIGDARMTIYSDTWRLIEARPVFGWGWQSFQYVYPEVQSSMTRMHARTGRYAVLDAHNDWMQALQEVGVFGALCLLCMVLGCMRWAGFAQWKRAPQSVLGLALLALAMLASVDFPLACPAVVLVAAITLAAASELARGSQGGLPVIDTGVRNTTQSTTANTSPPSGS